ncbi:hypothetical protein EON65_42255, partial [archaeon]
MEELFTPSRVSLGYNSKVMTGMVGLENLGATCYLNSLLQMLFHLNSFRRAVYQLPIDADEPSQSTPLALQSLFVGLQTSEKEVSTKELTRAFGWTSAEAFMQQDVQEMMRILIDKLEETVQSYNKRTSSNEQEQQQQQSETKVQEQHDDVQANKTHANFIKRMFAGKLKSYIHCVDIAYQSDRFEDFYDVQLDVKGCRDVHESFRRYVAIEMLEGDNQYYCEAHGGKFDAKKGVIFSYLPPILTIHLKRFDFDMQTMNFAKIHDYYEFPTLLCLDDYVERPCGGQTQAEVVVSENTYVLHSVLVHSGDVGGGHYYAYIRPATQYNQHCVYNLAFLQRLMRDELTEEDRAYMNQGCSSQTDQWFKYDDEKVFRVEELEAVHYCYGRKKSTYSFQQQQQHDKPVVQNALYEFYKQRMQTYENNINYNSTIMSSAYMLVYIRLQDALEIMKAVTVEDIPRPLQEKLHHITQFKAYQSFMQELRDNLIDVYHVTEYELATF